jgi:hypothetical protein
MGILEDITTIVGIGGGASGIIALGYTFYSRREQKRKEREEAVRLESEKKEAERREREERFLDGKTSIENILKS